MSELIYCSEDNTTKIYKVEFMSEEEAIDMVRQIEIDNPDYEVLARKMSDGEIAFWKEWGRSVMYVICTLMGIPVGTIHLP